MVRNGNVSEKTCELGPVAEPVSVEDQLSGHFVEYEALRTEIGWLLNGATQYQNFAIVLIGAYVALIGWVYDKGPNLIVATLLTGPFIFCLLGFLYYRQHEEVFVIAAYLSEYVRPRVRSIVRDEGLWGWEEFKLRRSQELYGATFFRVLTTNTMVLVLRTALFLVPSILSLIAIAAYVQSQGLRQFASTQSTLGNVLLTLAFVVDSIFVMLLLVLVLKN